MADTSRRRRRTTSRGAEPEKPTEEAETSGTSLDSAEVEPLMEAAPESVNSEVPQLEGVTEESSQPTVQNPNGEADDSRREDSETPAIADPTQGTPVLPETSLDDSVVERRMKVRIVDLIEVKLTPEEREAEGFLNQLEPGKAIEITLQNDEKPKFVSRIYRNTAKRLKKYVQIDAVEDGAKLLVYLRKSDG